MGRVTPEGGYEIRCPWCGRSEHVVHYADGLQHGAADEPSALFWCNARSHGLVCVPPLVTFGSKQIEEWHFTRSYAEAVERIGCNPLPLPETT